MNLPSFPTDNLYKFMAISGLFIIIFSAVFPLINVHNLRLKLVELETKTELIEIEASELGKEITIAEGKKDLTNEEREALRKKAIEMKMKLIELQGINKQLGVLTTDLRIALGFLIVGGLLGWTICIKGFRKWYYLVQAPSDLLLKKQIEEICSKSQIGKRKNEGNGPK